METIPVDSAKDSQRPGVATRYFIPGAVGILLLVVKITFAFFGRALFLSLDVLVFGAVAALFSRHGVRPWWSAALLTAGPAFLWTTFVLILLGPEKLGEGVGSNWLISAALLPVSAFAAAYGSHRWLARTKKL